MRVIYNNTSQWPVGQPTTDAEGELASDYVVNHQSIVPT
jgi:hypothetical protein